VVDGLVAGGFVRIGNFLVLCYLLCFELCLVMEKFVCRILKGGKVTVPKRLRELLGAEEGDYLRLAVTEVIKREGDQWIRRKVNG